MSERKIKDLPFDPDWFYHEEDINIHGPNPFKETLKEIKELITTSKVKKECAFCGKPVDKSKFTSKEDHEEYEISAMCKACMDEAFGESNHHSKQSKGVH